MKVTQESKRGSHVGVLRFLGTNCDRDVWQAVEAIGLTPVWLWHEDRFNPQDYRAFILPGGFSYGDYLRCGALAAKSPAMSSLAEAVKKGYPVLGICNGFQILCESGLLPGALVRNAGLKFVDDWVELTVNTATRWTTSFPSTSHQSRRPRLHLPVAHGEGRFYASEEELENLFAKGQVWLTYSGKNPNGSLRDIAGVCNLAKNVCGLMPHPERAMFDWMGDDSGRMVFTALLEA